MRFEIAFFFSSSSDFIFLLALFVLVYFFMSCLNSIVYKYQLIESGIKDDSSQSKSKRW